MLRTGDLSLAFNCVFSAKSDRHRLPGTLLPFDSDELAEIALKSLIPVDERLAGMSKEGSVDEDSSACAHREGARPAVGRGVAWQVAPVGPEVRPHDRGRRIHDGITPQKAAPFAALRKLKKGQKGGQKVRKGSAIQY
jgi:hypothetical protein